MKAEHISLASRLEDLPHIDDAVARLLRDAGIAAPVDLQGHSALWLYDKICQITRQTHCPRLLEQLLSAIDFASGKAPKNLAEFTAERCRLLAPGSKSYNKLN